MAKSKSGKSTDPSTVKTPTKTDAGIDGKKAGRDARIDEIGFAEELYDQYVEDLRTAVKTAGISRGLDRITGDFFTGTLAGGNAGSAIDPAKFFKLCEKKKIPRKNQIAAVAIGIKAAAQILSQDGARHRFVWTPLMKRFLPLALLALGLVATAAVVTHLVGCTASQLAATDAAIGGTPVAATTQTTTAPGTQPGQVVTETTTVQPTEMEQLLNLAKDIDTKVAIPAATTVTAAVPNPWSGVAIAGLTALSGILGIFAVKQTGAVGTANTAVAKAQAIITNAAPAAAALIKQVTDNQTLASDVTNIAQIAPALITLAASHPNGAAILQGVGQVVQALTPATVPGAVKTA